MFLFKQKVTVNREKVILEGEEEQLIGTVTLAVYGSALQMALKSTGIFLLTHVLEVLQGGRWEKQVSCSLPEKLAYLINLWPSRELSVKLPKGPWAPVHK